MILSVVIPAHNEAHRIGGTLEELCAHLPAVAASWEIRVVDDGSTDDTAAVVTSAIRSHPSVVLQREPHRGKGGAIRNGLLQARGELRFICDADLSMSVHGIAQFMSLVPDHCDVAIGTREGPRARRVREPGYRHVLGRAFNWFVRAAVGETWPDTQCGFKMFTAEAVQAIFPLTTIDGWAFDVEALVIARRRGLRVAEVPVEWHFRGRSQVSPLRDSFLMARDVLKVRANAAAGRYDPPTL